MSSKVRTALIVFLIGFALGISVFAASRLSVRSVLQADAAEAGAALAGRLASGDIPAPGEIPRIVAYTYRDMDGAVVASDSGEARDAAPDMAPGSAGTGVLHMLGLTESGLSRVTVPVASGGTRLGTLTAQIDQTASTDSLLRAFSLAGIIVLGLAVLAIVAIAYAVTRDGRLRNAAVFDRDNLLRDPLTGVPLRSGFVAMLEQDVAAAAEEDRQLGLLVVDIDDFRSVNDLWGHAAGDEILKVATHRLQAVEGAIDVARISGDHFAVIARDDATPLSLRRLAEAIQETLRQPYDVEAGTIRLAARIGAALYPVNAEDAAALFRAADSALTRAKIERSATLAFFDTDMKTRMARRADLEQDMRNALERDEFVLIYQPQRELGSGRLRGYEALLRWERPGKGIMAPGEFLPIAENTGLVRPLGDWMLRKACTDALAWPDGELVSIDILPAHFRFQDLDVNIAAALSATGLPAGRLEIEVPEELFFGGAPKVIETLRRIRELGVRIALANFGGRYCAPSDRAGFAFDKVKLGRQLVEGLNDGASGAPAIPPVVALGRTFAPEIAAEGVETRDQATLLQAAGCSIAQGYMLAEPEATASGESEQAAAG